MKETQSQTSTVSGYDMLIQLICMNYNFISLPPQLKHSSSFRPNSTAD